MGEQDSAASTRRVARRSAALAAAAIASAAAMFNALGAGDGLVTFGIGGNDAGLIGVAEECATLDLLAPIGTRCKDHYNSSGSDSGLRG